ncbi:MAG TPA: hypothetical protein VKA41_07220 [Solirubrobacterales bacterium]|nr:hypothetical protein [Solirubrobacterales bacterium]
MKRRYVLAGLAALAVLAVSSPALGGPSLKSLVKKEVKKQLAGKTGPQGPAGANGANGTNGTNGADGTARAYAYVDRFNCPDPGYPDDCAPLDPAKGVSSVTAVSAGVYCAIVPGLSPTTAPAIASVDQAQSFPGNASNAVLVNGLDSGVCTAGQYEFKTFDPAGDPASNVDTAFTFVIP